MSRPRAVLTLGIVLLAGLGACSESPTISSEEAAFRELSRARILVVSGASQEGVVGAFLAESLTVEVRSEGGIPMAGVGVEWAFQAGQGVTAGSGSVGTATSLVSFTDSRGRASAAWLLGTQAGPQHSSAQVLIPSPSGQGAAAGLPGYERGDSVGFSAVARPGPVATVEISPSEVLLRPGQALALTAESRDEFGNAVTGRETGWSVSDDGVAQVDDAGWVTGVADGTAEVRAVVDGVTGSRLVTVTASATS